MTAMTPRTARRRVALIIDFEPSWFAEFMSASGILMWSAFTLLSQGYVVTEWSWVVPIIGLLLGPLRMALLFNLEPRARVLVAAAGFVWWGTLTVALYLQWGVVPGMGAFSALFLGDALTMGRFSLAVIRPLEFGESS